MQTQLSVIIPNFNGRNLLENNLPSVFKALEAWGGSFEVIVADDASEDDSVSFLKKTYPEIILVLNQVNRGFSSNINSGLRRASGELVLALNNDVSLSADYFKPLLLHFKKSDTFGVMGALCNPKTQTIEDGAKLCEKSWGGLYRTTKNLLSPDSPVLPSLFLSGANAMMNREKLAAVGYFNELFDPFYNEDVELGLRAWRMGWKCVFDSRAKAYHATSQTIKRSSSTRKIRIISLRNRFFLHDIHFSTEKRFLFFVNLCFNFLFRWVTGDFAFYEALFSYLRSRSKAVESQRMFSSLKPKYTLEEVFVRVQREQSEKKCIIF